MAGLETFQSRPVPSSRSGEVVGNLVGKGLRVMGLAPVGLDEFGTWMHDAISSSKMSSARLGINLAEPPHSCGRERRPSEFLSSLTRWNGLNLCALGIASKLLS